MPAKSKPQSAPKTARPATAAGSAPVAGKAALLSSPPPRRRLKLPPSGRRIGSENLFWATICFSILVHALLLALNFSLPNFVANRQHDKGLEIVLVNARHAHAPKKPQALAQANMDGGGNTADKAMPSTPLPPQDQTRNGDALVETLKRAEQLEAVQRELLTQSRKTVVPSVDRPAPQESPTTPQPRGLDLIDSARAIARQEALVDKQLREYAERPRKSFISARTTEYRFAQYVEDWRQKVERIGTMNFPRNTHGKLYGNLLVSVEIRADGSIANVEVRRSSGNRALDEAALRILHLASPFAAFPADIRKDTDILVINRTWMFSNADALETRSQ